MLCCVIITTELVCGGGRKKEVPRLPSAPHLHTCHRACFRHAGHVQGGLVLSLSSHGMLWQVQPVSASLRKVIPLAVCFFGFVDDFVKCFLTGMSITKSLTARKDERKQVLRYAKSLSVAYMC